MRKAWQAARPIRDIGLSSGYSMSFLHSVSDGDGKFIIVMPLEKSPFSIP
ncbi:hypothetical protein GLGR_1513 [Leminorella grimontii ATCC 33999 = DSM 5078]|nr:hypothetical protein GLGR_1513 [Leminorella grimontii ATCC 33999 = DSM 5078]